jgi:hypothetical protein
MPSVLISASFVYPFKGGRISEPVGLTSNSVPGWTRLHLVGDIATDIPADTSVLTDQGWLTPSELISQNAHVTVHTLSQTISVNGYSLTFVGKKAYKALSLASLTDGEAIVDQLSTNIELGGDQNSPSVSVVTQYPLPAEICECVFLNQQCGAPHENLNDLVSFSF